MKASDLITLTIIDKIFTEKATTELKPLTKILYINILTHHFKTLEATEKNLFAFEMPKDKLQYEKFKDYYRELFYAKIVNLEEQSIIFNNVWGSYINRNILNNLEIDSSEQVSKPAIYFKDIIGNSQSVFDLIAMKHRWTRMYYLKVVELFFTEQSAIQTKYNHENDCKRHFINWCDKNYNKLNLNPNGTQTKILGT